MFVWLDYRENNIYLSNFANPVSFFLVVKRACETGTNLKKSNKNIHTFIRPRSAKVSWKESCTHPWRGTYLQIFPVLRKVNIYIHGDALKLDCNVTKQCRKICVTISCQEDQESIKGGLLDSWNKCNRIYAGVLECSVLNFQKHA